MLLKMLQKFFVFCFDFFAKCNFPTWIDYSTNMCWTSYEPTVVGAEIVGAIFGCMAE